MSAPVRIQRKRTKGWRMPEGVVYVGRPTIWGNPFWLATEWFGAELSVALFRMSVCGVWSPHLLEDATDEEFDALYAAHVNWHKRLGGHPLEILREPGIRGRDLACWCPLDRPCHADVLLEIANAGGAGA